MASVKPYRSVMKVVTGHTNLLGKYIAKNIPIRIFEYACLYISRSSFGYRGFSHRAAKKEHDT
ncbi:uncharacterized protein PHALS_01443 [Plasmopara halstedii]|uniref:Uncharacterized protein n=1 Tax=Plasmopara halstedii TaxID=4781 RepID=A0A0P1ATD6_PLAHL|nr:uncharacterized protein PHALS_01443 [Plasmopara halstedii]CEG45122.1 hypothetical protein PHALS_01443 [Plasmopara halstedii]|eukprot:XP_024581491.1 hypothetical protein PHALS_01443 [Plasmopara halstedii]